MFIITSCSDDGDYSEDYDIKWPVPTISSISPADSAVVSSDVILTGTGLDKVMSLTIDNRTMTIVEKSATSLKATLPRKFNTATIAVTNLYRRTVISEKTLAPKYPDVEVSAYPDQIVKEQVIVISGANLDLVTSVLVGTNIVAVASTNPTSLNVPTAGLKINVGDQVVIEVRSTFSDVINSKSGDIDIVE
jgi:hypothetical protein